jgi:ubiquinol-cytochrome c reductase cytochrome b/c1 subunit
MRKLILATFATLAFAAATPSLAAEAMAKPERQSWSFAGPFGTYDRGQLQRGFKVYREVCAVCHSLKYVAFRNLVEPGGPGFSEAQAKAVAAEYKINDGPNDSGDMFERPGRLSDYFPSPYANDQAARFTHGGALPPDLSVIAKARGYEVGFPGFVFDFFRQYQESGVDYLHALLTGYENPPQGVTLTTGQNWNKYFPGHRIAMRPPLTDGEVEYTDGTPQKAEQYSRDVTAFLMWAAEPHLEARKRIGFQVMIFLVLFAGLSYFTKKKIWSKVDGHA